MTSMRVWLPQTVQDAWSLKNGFAADSCYAAGSTWLQLSWESSQNRPSELISLERVGGLNEKSVHSAEIGNVLEIPVRMTLEEVLRSPIVATDWPLLHQACTSIGAVAVRNRATLVGNVCSRRGDSIPLLLALDANLNVFNGSEDVTLPLVTWLSEKSAGQHNQSDIVQSVLIPAHVSETPKSLQGIHEVVFYRKIGQRQAFSIAFVTVAGRLQVADGDHIVDARLAIGGGSHVPARLYQSENLLLGQKLSPGLWRRLHEKIMGEVQSYSDAFASQAYRKHVAANTLTSGLASRVANWQTGHK